VWRRFRCAVSLLLDVRTHDLRAARTFVNAKFGGSCFFKRWFRFFGWTLRQLFCVIPEAIIDVSIDRPIDRTPMWLMDPNPLANHPWQTSPDSSLPKSVDTVAIGAGFTGAALGYHWSKKASPDRVMAVLEMDDPATGASGRNEGLVVMGRYFSMVHHTVLAHLDRVRKDLTPGQQDQLARQFAVAYCRAAYKNGDMVQQTVKTESFDCDYVRGGWIQAHEADQQSALDASVSQAKETGTDDWTRITPEQVYAKTGMQVQHNGGFSPAAAAFHPAKWVWSLVAAALTKPHVQLFTRTKVLSVQDCGEYYAVHTNRGVIQARHVVNATESYAPLLHRRFHNVVLPVQTQAAAGDNGPPEMKPHIGISGTWFFCGRHGDRVMIGSDATRIPDRKAGCNNPSRFLTKFLCGEMNRYFEPSQFHVTNEWSGTVGFTPDEYPIVGLIDNKRQYIIAGMCGSGTAVSFNASRCTCNRILGIDEADDYPPEYFAPTRLLDPDNHPWPSLELSSFRDDVKLDD